ncbi:MAG: DUF3160 domain-containing protein [Armatimonadota bacterium]
MKRLAHLALVTALAAPLMIIGCDDGDGPAAQPGERAADAEVTITIDDFDPQAAFREWYEPVEYEAEPQTPGYDLPLDLSEIVNLDDVAHRLPDGGREMLARRGFVVADYGTSEDIIAIYSWADDTGIPPFVTVDTLLHLYHLQFDQTLKVIEETRFAPEMADFSRAMMQIMLDLHGSLGGDLQEAARRNVAYFAVGLRCLEPDADVPAPVASMVAEEIALIEARAGFTKSPIFGYDEDYSQYVPRGHYTRSETLERYFKAMMWYGRLSMLLKGGDDAIISEEEARIQTLQAALIPGTLYRPERAELLETWRRIYAVTAFYAGFADDLTPQEYAEAIAQVAGGSLAWTNLASDETLHALRSELATYRAPQIYGGTGEIALDPPFSPEQLDELLADTMGMRLLGQRFIPDGYMMQKLGFPSVLGFTGEGRPFSMEMTQGGPQRVFPRGLDVMAALGSERAYQILEAEGDTAWQNYDEQLAALREEFGEVSEADWNRNLYWSWLHSLQALLAPVGEGYPNFMRTDEWQDRTLWAALASWTELRHDTILYAKQPYMPIATAMPMQPDAPPPGYVEPRPEFYARMLALARMTRTGLEEMEVLDDQSLARLRNLEAIIERMLDISLTQLRGEAISDEDAEYIKYIAGRLKSALIGIEQDEQKSTIVADVLTDTNTRQVLEQGVGYIKLLVAAYQIPDGRIVVGVGPVLSQYEFKHPMGDRLTNEAWREKLRNAPPAAAPWVESFYAGR